ncbi:MAG: PqqD family protein, partial [Theionarchaea archaeon]|nr:PqqD family protein [Theionarchaea archaeon]
MNETHMYIRWSEDSIWDERDGRVLICRLPELDFAADLRIGKNLIWLNREGSRVWNLCDGTRTLEGIISLLLDAHTVEHAVLEKDVTDLVHTLYHRGLIEFREEKASPPHMQSIDRGPLAWSESVVWNDMDEEVGILNCKDGSMIVLGSSERELWRMCDGTRTAKDIIAGIKS